MASCINYRKVFAIDPDWIIACRQCCKSLRSFWGIPMCARIKQGRLQRLCNRFPESFSAKMIHRPVRRRKQRIPRVDLGNFVFEGK